MTSFGNMGFAKPICAKENIVWDNYNSGQGQYVHVNLSFQCERTTVITDVIDSGILLSSGLPYGHHNTLATCFTDPEHEGDKVNYFDKKLDKAAFQQELLKQCKGKTFCQASVNTVDIMYMRRFDGVIEMPPNLTIFAQAKCQHQSDADL